MKKLLCLALSCLLLLSMAACKSGDGDTSTPTEAPEQTLNRSLEQYGPWVLTTEYEKSTDKNRQYYYGENGELLGYGDYQATTTTDDQGGKTVKLVAYDEDGQVSTYLSKHEYVYNADGKLVSYQRNEALGDKLADSFTFEYDAAGNMVKQEKYYMDLWQETVTYTYDGEKLTAASFKSSVYEASYTYVYDGSGVLSQLDYNIKYVKSGNVDKGTLALQKSVYEDDTTYRVVLSTSSSSDGVAQGKEVVIYEECYDAEGNIQSVQLEFKDWGAFQVASVPMRQYGAMNTANWSGGSAKFVYQPLSVYLAEQEQP